MGRGKAQQRGRNHKSGASRGRAGIWLCVSDEKVAIPEENEQSVSYIRCLAVCHMRVTSAALSPRALSVSTSLKRPEFKCAAPALAPSASRAPNKVVSGGACEAPLPSRCVAAQASPLSCSASSRDASSRMFASFSAAASVCTAESLQRRSGTPRTTVTRHGAGAALSSSTHTGSLSECSWPRRQPGSLAVGGRIVRRLTTKAYSTRT
eukprot:6206409-Pleurochrysis_carterae.AAC.1